MDFRRKISDFLKTFYPLTPQKRVLQVCKLFDDLKNYELTDKELDVLYYISNCIGVPQYFHMLLIDNNLDYEISDSLFDFETLLKETNLLFEPNHYYHIFQKQIVDCFNNSKRNRFIISAPTSFGKTTVVYNIMRKMKYGKVCLIFPTISLLMENLTKVKKMLIKNNNTKKIITLSDENLEDDSFICILTPERFMSFIDKHKDVYFDFCFMDEIYKLDNFILRTNETQIENERDLSFRIALNIMCKHTKDLLLAGPYLNFTNNGSFSCFLSSTEITELVFNEVELVDKNFRYLKELKEKYSFVSKKESLSKKEKISLLNILLDDISPMQTIVYCEGKASAEEYCREYIEHKKRSYIEKECTNSQHLEIFKEHIKNKFSDNWILYKGLCEKVGVHHGTIPKYIQKEIIKLFEAKEINVLFSTTTITEGINTNAKNIVILSGKKGQKKLHVFDAKNIVGRAGRFFNYYSGNVYILDPLFGNIIKEKESEIQHIDFDVNSEKSEPDIFISQDEFLNENQKEIKKNILEEGKAANFPTELSESFFTIDYSIKIKEYLWLENLPDKTKNVIFESIQKFSVRRCRMLELEVIIRCIKQMLTKNTTLYFFAKSEPGRYSVLTRLLEAYILGGLKGLVDYKVKKEKTSYDKAFRESAHLVYNIFRYELVKYLGFFDALFRIYFSKKLNLDSNEVNGLSGLLNFLEFGCYTESAKKASDFGVPFDVIKYIDNSTDNKINLDEYEIKCYEDYISIYSN